MYATPRRTVESKSKSKDKSKDETPVASRKTAEEKLKRSLSNLSTPRHYLQKSSTTDIYGQRKNTNPQVTKAPKKATGSIKKTVDVSPMKGLLKSTSSTTTLLNSARSNVNTPRHIPRKDDSNILNAPKAVRTKKEVLATNVTVNSPVLKKKLIKDIKTEKSVEPKSVVVERQRTNTRTLGENEAKVLTIDAVDNNAEMQNLTRKLSAKPKVFYVDLKDDKSKSVKDEKISEDEVSYEDDFESYESDFESYHSDKSSNKTNVSENATENEDSSHSDDEEITGTKVDNTDNSLKENKDEERMLDSGSFDLRDAQRSAQKSKPLEFITEHSEYQGDKRILSLTDEGFQDMSSSSTASSMKTMHVEVLERPLFIDFTKSKESRKRKQRAQMIQQRAKDLLNMITLHTMSYTLFELNPIPYDVYMATYGRDNYKQAEVQTYDDGITEEVQTDDVELQDKWTQHPIDFSKHLVCTHTDNKTHKRFGSSDNFLSKFTFLTSDNGVSSSQVELNDEYKTNPLRIYLEQKEGVGANEMLPYEKYQSKFNQTINMDRLGKFMKKAERIVTNVISSKLIKSNADEFDQTSTFPFSDSYTSLSTRNLSNKFEIVKQYKIVDVIFSDRKNNLAMTVHKKSYVRDKGIICLWDVSVRMENPLKTLIAVDDVSLAKFHGGTDGVFIAALKDSSLHLWDLSEKPTYSGDHDDEAAQIELLDVNNSDKMSQVESDREWNLKNSNVRHHKNFTPNQSLHSCAYTSSAFSINNKDVLDTVAALELLDGTRANLENGRKIIGQICSLLRIGILTIWSIIQEKRSNIQVSGKAYWSRTKLEKNLHISLTDYVDKSISGNISNLFNLNAAKRRISRKKSERSLLSDSRPKSGGSSDSFDIDRPASAASRKSRSCTQIESSNSWDSGLVCKDLKVIKLNGVDHYLIAKNCGEVYCLTRNAGVVKLNTFCVTTDMSSVTKLEVSPHGLPYFLAASDAGTVNLCSLIDSRVLLTLDCRNGPPTPPPEVEKYQTDSKGRFIGTKPIKSPAPSSLTTHILEFQATLKSVHWLPTNPCSIVTLSLDGVVAAWQLEHSDICPSFTKQTKLVQCALAQGNLAFVTQDGDVEIHRLSNKQNLTNNLSLFQKYVTLL